MATTGGLYRSIAIVQQNVSHPDFDNNSQENNGVHIVDGGNMGSCECRWQFPAPYNPSGEINIPK